MKGQELAGGKLKVRCQLVGDQDLRLSVLCAASTAR